jgi:GTP-binding protein
MIDASVGLTDNDKKISDEIIAAKKPVIIAVNKWDAIEKDHKTFEAFKDRLIFKFFRAADFPIISVSAKSKQRINKLLDTAIELDAKARKRIATPALNRAMAQIKSSARIPQLNEKLRVYYAVQLESIPPQFKLFVNNAEYFKKDVIRYFEKALKEAFGLHGLPIFIQIEGKNRNYGRRKAKS